MRPCCSEAQLGTITHSISLNTLSLPPHHCQLQVAGVPGTIGSFADGAAVGGAAFSSPAGILYLDGEDILLVADSGNGRLRAVFLSMTPVKV